MASFALRRPQLLFRKTSSNNPQKPRKSPQEASDTTKPSLLNFSELPPWLQDNPHIRTSYRPVSNSYNKCIHSLSYLHNETFNVYTHLIPTLTLAFALPTLQIHISSIYATAPWMDRFMLTLTPMATLLTLSLSSSYHTFMNHSACVSSTCLLLDYTGILGLILASFISGIYVGFYDSPFHQRLYWTMILTLIATSCVLVLHPRLQGPGFRSHRTAAFILTALSGFAPVIHGCVFYGYGEAFWRKGVMWWLAEGFWYGLGAYFFATRVPESLPWAKGRFDVLGSSHQIFHICVVLGAACHCWGVWWAWKCAV